MSTFAEAVKNNKNRFKAPPSRKTEIEIIFDRINELTEMTNELASIVSNHEKTIKELQSKPKTSTTTTTKTKPPEPKKESS